MSNLPITTPAEQMPTFEGYSHDQVLLIRDTICKGATVNELKLFMATAGRLSLDPFLGQICAVKRGNKALGREEMKIQVQIDGFRAIADRSEAYAGSDEAEFIMPEKGPYPISARVTVWKIVQGVRCAFSATAHWTEFYPGDGNPGFMWRKMPKHMLAKVAEAQALRKAFPSQLGGIYAEGELDRYKAEIEHENEVFEKSQAPIETIVDKTPLLDAIKLLAGKLTEGKSLVQKGQFMREAIGVQKFDELKSMSMSELQGIKQGLEELAVQYEQEKI